MGKIEINAKIDYYLDWKYGVEIKKIREDLDELEKLGATNVDIEYGESYGDPYCHIEAYSRRLENDEEFEKRMENERKRQENIKAHELKTLEQLKKKYEDAKP